MSLVLIQNLSLYFRSYQSWIVFKPNLNLVIADVGKETINTIESERIQVYRIDVQC